MSAYIIYTDASVVGRKKSMKGGLAYIINGEAFSEYHESVDINHLELIAIIKAISRVIPTEEEIHIYSDSAYVVEHASDGSMERWKKQGWKTDAGNPIKNINQWKMLYGMCAAFNITFYKVKAHTGDIQNSLCDRLAKNAAEKQTKLSKNSTYRSLFDTEGYTNND